jgi:phosphate transport system permease protein
MWGLFIFAPLFATYFQEPVGNVLSAIPFVGALFLARHLVSVFWRLA